MDFSLTADQLAHRNNAVSFAEANLNHDIIARDKHGIFNRDLWRKCAEFGLLGMVLPQEYGGQDCDLISATLSMEGLGYGCLDNGLTFALSCQIWAHQPLLTQFGSDTQKQKYLPRMASGEWLSAYCMTEPESGSDAFSLSCSAEKTSDGYKLNGQKSFVTFGPEADFAIVFASTRPDAGKWGISTFLVDKGTDGFIQSDVQDKMGLRTIPIGKFTFEECVVPEENRLGPEGAGASMFNHSQAWERSFILASQIGAMERQLDEAIEFARNRQQFGQAIGKFQSVSNRIADMKVRLETAKLLQYKVAWLKQQGKPNMLEAAIAKLYLGQCFVDSGLDSIAIHGGRGYLTEYGVERNLRDAIGGPVYGGTSDIQRNIIARMLGL